MSEWALEKLEADERRVYEDFAQEHGRDLEELLLEANERAKQIDAKVKARTEAVT